jgi:hypothetical protein
MACLDSQTRPEERGDIFPDNAVRFAERGNICLLTTTHSMKPCASSLRREAVPGSRRIFLGGAVGWPSAVLMFSCAADAVAISTSAIQSAV